MIYVGLVVHVQALYAKACEAHLNHFAHMHGESMEKLWLAGGARSRDHSVLIECFFKYQKIPIEASHFLRATSIPSCLYVTTSPS